MKNPRICAVIVDKDLASIREVEPLVSLYEVRIDLIGDGWSEVINELGKPWLACNRRADEGGQWRRSETERIQELFKALEIGASIVDVELRTAGLEEIVKTIKNKARCLVSFHDLKETSSLDGLKKIVKRELEAGADICKVVTTAQRLDDNLLLLKLLSEFPKSSIVSFAMGPLGLASRILLPLVGGEFTYAAIKKGGESAPGQITVSELNRIYEMVAQ